MLMTGEILRGKSEEWTGGEIKTRTGRGKINVQNGEEVTSLPCLHWFNQNYCCWPWLQFIALHTWMSARLGETKTWINKWINKMCGPPTPTILWGQSHAAVQSKTPGLRLWNGHNITAYKGENLCTQRPHNCWTGEDFFNCVIWLLL